MTNELDHPQCEPIRVLVADDEPITRFLTASKLARLNGHVLEAEDGLSAWDLLLSQPCQLAVIDLEMPKLDGFGLIQCVRGHPNTKHLPIVVLTSRDDKEAIERALIAGATSYLIKPLNWKLFGHHIGHLLELGREAARGVREPEPVSPK
ncbi:MAG TPA: response regulator [Hyphomicrobiaceae bacterium]|jgi:CheY-like chemotaxis protein|nr:response regulator [Hyphomicrobiaceae bacterium]